MWGFYGHPVFLFFSFLLLAITHTLERWVFVADVTRGKGVGLDPPVSSRGAKNGVPQKGEGNGWGGKGGARNGVPQ